jgi:hypothetical protein
MLSKTFPRYLRAYLASFKNVQQVDNPVEQRKTTSHLLLIRESDFAQDRVWFLDSCASIPIGASSLKQLRSIIFSDQKIVGQVETPNLISFASVSERIDMFQSDEGNLI